jgi:hypothetical protein
MAIAVHDLHTRQERRSAVPTTPGQRARPPFDQRAASHMARLDYQRQYQGQGLSEHALCMVLQDKMEAWQKESVPTEWQVAYISGWHAAILEDHVSRETTRCVHDIIETFQTFGTFIKFLRERSQLSKTEVIAEFSDDSCLLGVNVYEKLECGRRCPHFDELLALYQSLVRSGVEITPPERVAYLELAMAANSAKRRKRERISEEAWQQLSCELASFDEDTPVRVQLPRSKARMKSAPEMRRASDAATELCKLAGEFSVQMTTVPQECSALLSRMVQATASLGVALCTLTGMDEMGGMAQ